MGVSTIHEQRQLILDTIRAITQGDWKVMVVDETSKKIIDNVVREDDILSQNISNIEHIEEKRASNPGMDAIYIISPQPHIVECLVADLDQHRYRRSFLVWTSVVDRGLRSRINASSAAQRSIAGFQVLSIDYFPRESNLVTFRDPWSFPILYHPACNSLVRDHMQELAQKITALCVSLGEYPIVRYYRPPIPVHEASVLCSHLARFVQDELDSYAQFNADFPPPTTRPRGLLLITDRSMDVYAPVLHEFTYQAMAHDLLHIKEGDRITYKTIINGGKGEEEKDLEITEKDKIWVDNRHQHMKDTIDKLMGDFRKFMQENAHFTEKDSEKTTTLNDLKNMLVGLPQFQEMKDAYSLHLNMAQECMGKFESHKLPDVASLEQSLATGLDEDYKKPKNLAVQLVRLLDDPDISPPDRLRLLMLYVMYRDGIIPADMQKLLAHAGLTPHDGETVHNLDLLGVRSIRQLKESRLPPAPLFPRKTNAPADAEEYTLSRFEPNLKHVLEEVGRGMLDPQIFPYTKPPMDGEETVVANQASLRSAKPTWARNRVSVVESRQRVIVFMAGGATFSEARTCYEMSKHARDVVLVSSHMLTPALFLRQVGDLSVDRRRLDLPADRPKPRPPAHLFERLPPPQPTPSAGQVGGPPRPGGPTTRRPVPSAAPPTGAMAAMNLSSTTASSNGSPAAGTGKLEKKKKGFFSSKR